MAIVGQDQIESVSQAMFLTVPPKGLSGGDHMQDAGLYREDASMNRHGNPWIVTGPPAAAIAVGRVEPTLLRWVGADQIGDEIKLLNTAGEVVWHARAIAGMHEADESMRGETWAGLTAPVMESGTLYITWRQFGRTA